MKAFILLFALLLAGCAKPAPGPAVWVPKVGERVAENFCSSCKDFVGRVRIVTVTQVITDESGRTMVYANEAPAGIPLQFVAKWQ